jgi:hypothetical protein
MKTMILLVALFGLSAAQAGVVRVNNAKSAKYLLGKGSYPSKLSVRVEGWNNKKGKSTVNFKYVRVESDRFGGEGYSSKSEAVAALKDMVALAKNGQYYGMVKRAVILACSPANSLKVNFGRNGKFVEELIDMGYVGAGKYRVEEEFDGNFNQVYVPGFTIYIPCKY